MPRLTLSVTILAAGVSALHLPQPGAACSRREVVCGSAALAFGALWPWPQATKLKLLDHLESPICERHAASRLWSSLNRPGPTAGPGQKQYY